MRSTSRTSRRLIRRPLARLTAALAGLALVVPLTALTASPAAADNVVTPGSFTGYGFDQCVAPTQRSMDRWLTHSPFLAVGIYISGDSRGCRNQPNLSRTWISTQLRKGWRLLPIALGPQASCHPSFPRYNDDFTISPRPGDNGRYRKARRQGRREATRNVEDARAYGITPGSTLWYDLEGFDLGNTHCRESALAFVSSWTARVHRLGYVSGMYSSAGSGIRMLDDARVNRPGQFRLPRHIWIARWDGQANTSTDYIRPDGWLPGRRMKQYRGGHQETWGGVTINIDSNYLDLGRGSVADPDVHCGGVAVDYRSYPAQSRASSDEKRVKALQCLLKEKGMYGGRIHGRYNDRTVNAVARWQQDRGFATSATFGRAHWLRLLVEGATPVAKIGSYGNVVHRLQRALNASGVSKVRITGTFDERTRLSLREYQSDVGTKVTGVAAGPTWRKLRRGQS
jgi:RNA-binding protein YhbY